MKKSSIFLITAIGFIFAIGLLMVFDTTAAEVLDRSASESTHIALLKQLCYGVIGLFLAALVYHVGYERIIRISPILLLLTTGLLLGVFLPGIGQEINGAKRWVGIAHFSLQPSELAKFMIPLYFIYNATQKEWIHSFRGFCYLLILCAIPIGLILMEPDNGTTAIMLFTLVVLFMLTKVKWVYWALPLLLLVVLGVGAASQMPHVHSRIHTFLHPELDLQGKGHQPHQAKIAAGSGGVFGKGIGESMQKLNYLPEARSDYIAAIFAEECGFIGISFLIFLYMVIGCTGFYIAAKSADKEGFYLAAIITFLITFQAFLNLGVVSGLLPSKGIALPFFSQGGSSLIVNSMAVGLLLSVDRMYLKKRKGIKR